MFLSIYKIVLVFEASLCSEDVVLGAVWEAHAMIVCWRLTVRCLDVVSACL
jgi:hypothetical protein